MSSTRRIPWLRWTLAVAVVDLWVLAANATDFAAYLEATVSTRLVSEVIALIAPPPDFSMNEPFSQLHIWIASTMLGLLFLSPILVVLVIAWRRSDPMAAGTSQLPAS